MWRKKCVLVKTLPWLRAFHILILIRISFDAQCSTFHSTMSHDSWMAYVCDGKKKGTHYFSNTKN